MRTKRPGDDRSEQWRAVVAEARKQYTWLVNSKKIPPPEGPLAW